MAGKYPKREYVAHATTTVLQHKRASDKVIEHPREQPGNIIIIHGVNDVGTSYADVEAGLCAGLEQRLYRHFKPADYTLPTDKDKVVDDPDAVYYKRKVSKDTNSPVIPFYWGFREIGKHTKTVNGQKTDRYGNRLDKDLSKEGGPFGNATSTLPDMWNCGVGAPADVMNDPLRPLRSGPGRMYMVLAARRLAALVAMIRDYEPKDTVTIVAHSQGCLIGLLAQAFLMERGERTADTLILTHPPYGLDEDLNWKVKAINIFSGGTDGVMALYYDRISGTQTMNARLQTLVNIVQGVAKAKANEPVFAKIDEASCGGMVEGRWKPAGDRDNRGKVYLYFSPEDMTVALDNMKGIGWQGVPDYIRGTRWTGNDGSRWRSETIMRRPLAELGAGFRQRVFTAKQRLDPRTQKVGPVLVGLPPHDFALRLKGEDDHAHVESSGRDLRASLPVARWPVRPGDTPEEQRNGIRAINGEPLANPCLADMRGSQVDADKIPAGSSHAMLKPADRGPCEEVDPITAAIAITSNSGIKGHVEERPDPAGFVSHPSAPQLLGQADLQRMETAYNAEKNPKNTDPDDRFTVLSATRHPNGKVLAVIGESPNAARRRWQHELGAKSFHSAIFDSARNHSQVTAYDVAIGSGKAASDPKFYAYLCAVADWRLKKPEKQVDKPRPGILRWERFVTDFGAYFQCEPQWRRELIEGNADYYSFGNLPACLPLLTGRLWDIVVSETVTGTRIGHTVDVEETS